MKRRTVVAFFLTLALYILLGSLFMPLQKMKPHQRKRVTSLNLQNIMLKKQQPPTPNVTKPTPKPVPAPKPQPKKREKVVKKVKKRIVKHKKKSQKYVRKKVQERNSTKLAKRSFSPPRTAKSKPQHPKPPSLAALFASAKPKKSTLTDLPKEYRKLYKDEFDTFTQAQKRFLKDNLSRIGYITQKYLYLRGYPYIAVKTRQQGTNIVEFYLHPNGDITGLKLIGSSGYEALDKNSIETIKAAYKDYPLPKETTKIRIYVKYRLIY